MEWAHELAAVSHPERIVMNGSRIALAAVGATVAYFVLGGLAFGLGPLRNEFRNYPAVYRTAESMKGVAPVGIIAMFVAMVVLAVIYAMLYRGGSGIAEGARFGALIGVFAICAFVLHNYVNLNIGLKLTLGEAARAPPLVQPPARGERSGPRLCTAGTCQVWGYLSPPAPRRSRMSLRVPEASGSTG